MTRTKELKTVPIENDNTAVINIEIKNVDTMLKNDGNAASIEERLGRTIEEYLFKAVKCYPIKQKARLLIIVNEKRRTLVEKDIVDIVHRHFRYKAKETEIFLKEQFRQWAVNSVIGILFLVLCIILGEILDKFTYIGLVKIIKESLLIIGWVALWEPVTFILFGWRVIKRDKLYFKKLSSIPIEVAEKRFINQLYIDE